MGASVAEDGGISKHYVLLAILAVSFLHLFMRDGGYAYSEILALFSLAFLCFSIFVSTRNQSDAEFSSIARAFLAFALLFLCAQIIFLSVTTISRTTFYLLNILWLAGFIPPIWVCWRTILKYGEYIQIKTFILIVLVVFFCAFLILVPLGNAVATSDSYPGTLNKMIAVTYPFLDAILVMGLLTLMHMYKRGHLETYWETITTGILMFTLGDMGNAVARAYDASTLARIFDGLYSASYLYLAYSFALVAYRKRRMNIMAPGRMYRIKEVFLIHKSGILAAYIQGEEEAKNAGEQGSGIDRDILGGMLTAVQTFIRDSFDQEKWTDDGGSELKRLQYGDLEIHVENGKQIFLAVVLAGKGTDHLHNEMISLIGAIEYYYANVLVDWNGRMDLFAGVEDMIRQRLL